MKTKKKEFEALKRHVLLLEKRVRQLEKVTEFHQCKKCQH
jgi:hypothetical protein